MGPGRLQHGLAAFVAAYKPAEGLPNAALQRIQWNNFTTTFSSALASKTGPAVSSGGGFQAFQFADQGYIAMADNLISTWEKDGFRKDFLPGTVEAMKTDKGYVAVPWQTDFRVWWYRKSLFDDAGAKVPTDLGRTDDRRGGAEEEGLLRLRATARARATTSARTRWSS